MADRLLLLIPGYQFVFQRNATLALLKQEVTELVADVHPPGNVTAASRGGLSGFSISVDGKTTEMYEVSWQDHIVLLNQKKLLQRITGGFIASISWVLNRNVLRALADNKVYLMWFVVSALLMVLWFYGIIAVAMVAAGALQTPVQVPANLAAVLVGVRADALAVGTAMQGWWVWVLLSAALAALGIRPDFIADLADVMQRYLSNSHDDDPAGLHTLAERLRRGIYDVVSTLPTDSEEVLIVGHSFGALIAVDAVASGLPRKVSLMTLGSLIQFLKARRPDLQTTAERCGSSVSLTKWSDYGSNEDWFGSFSNATGSANAYAFHLVQFGIPFIKRFSLAAHRAYYSDSIILRAMLAS